MRPAQIWHTCVPNLLSGKHEKELPEIPQVSRAESVTKFAGQFRRQHIDQAFAVFGAIRTGLFDFNDTSANAPVGLDHGSAGGHIGRIASSVDDAFYFIDDWPINCEVIHVIGAPSIYR